MTYTLASAQALAGDIAGALATLRHYAALGYAADLAADPDFAALHGSEAYEEVGRRLRRNREPLVASRWWRAGCVRAAGAGAPHRRHRIRSG
ncbi:hypothetical protein BH24GEM1_BH24GEM1_21940 [soil metagenome]